MVEGEKRRFWIPAKLAYEGKPDRPQGMLVFDVELLDVLRVPAVPPDVAAPPADAEVTRSGLASKVLTAGTGTRHPRRDSIVKVHYTGWTTDGKMFDSSIPKGAPAVFKLTQVIPGWTEGLQLMVEGETRRFWIPKKLAYGQPNCPKACSSSTSSWCRSQRIGERRHRHARVARRRRHRPDADRRVRPVPHCHRAAAPPPRSPRRGGRR